MKHWNVIVGFILLVRFYFSMVSFKKDFNSEFKRLSRFFDYCILGFWGIMGLICYLLQFWAEGYTQFEMYCIGLWCIAGAMLQWFTIYPMRLKKYVGSIKREEYCDIICS